VTEKEGRALGRALTLLVLAGVFAGCGSVYTSSQNASLIGLFEDEVDYDTPPIMVQAVRPEYPDIARKMGAEGVVRLKALIREDGKIGMVQIMESANPILTDAAITALRQSVFIPAKRAGQPCCGTVIIPFVFGSEENWARGRQGVVVEPAGGPEEYGLAPAEPEASPESSIKPSK
jgi:TonB family protein